MYNGNDTRVAPDIIFGDGDDTFQPLLDNSDLSPCNYLRDWTAADPTRLLKLILVMRLVTFSVIMLAVSALYYYSVIFKMLSCLYVLPLVSATMDNCHMLPLWKFLRRDYIAPAFLLAASIIKPSTWLLSLPSLTHVLLFS